MAGHDRTEKATPKKRADARKKGQVAKSADFNGAVVLLASLLALSAFGPGLLQRVGDATRRILQLVATPSVVGQEGVGTVLRDAGTATAQAVGMDRARLPRQRRRGSPRILAAAERHGSHERR